MHYVEMLRARRVLTWYGGILFALVAIGLALVFKDGPPSVQMARDRNPEIFFDAIFAGTLFAPIFLAPFMAVGLDAEFKTAAIAWTRPLPRLVIAARYVAVDFLTLVVAWLFTLVLTLVTIVTLGLGPYLVGARAADVALSAALAFGCAVMWYGLVVLCTMLVPGHGVRISSASWAYVLLIPGLAAIPFSPLLHQAAVATNYVNPLAYLKTDDPTGISRHVQLSSSEALIPGSALSHALVVWLIGLAAVALATRIWVKREVPV